MWSMLFPEWDEMGTGRKIVGVLAPVVGGVATGLSGTSSTFFYLFNTWGAISGAISFGAEHRTRKDALLRGAASGVAYALTLVTVLHLTGNARIDAGFLLPGNDVVLFLLMAGVSFPLHLLGMRIRNALDPLPEPLPALEPRIVVGLRTPAEPAAEPAAAPRPLTRRESRREPALR